MKRKNTQTGDSQSPDCLKKTEQIYDCELMKHVLAMKAMRVVTWEMDIPVGEAINANTVCVYSQEYRQYFGFENEEDFPNVLGSWSGRIHPEDKDRVVAAYLAHIYDRTGETPCEIEYRFMRKGGEYRYIRNIGETIRDSAGEPIKMVGAKEDITEKTEANRQKQISISSLEKILDGIEAHIYVTVPKTGELLFVNKQLRVAAGRENDDFVGEYCYKVLRGLDELCEFCPCHRLEENPEQTIVWEEYVEIYDRHVIHSDSYIDWPNGEKVHLQHIIDITEIRNMTNALNKRLEQQSLMAKISQSFLSGENIDVLITNALGEIGEFMGVAQILLFEAEESGDVIVCRNEWIRPEFNKPSRIGGKMPMSGFLRDHLKEIKKQGKAYITADELDIKEAIAPYRVNFFNFLAVAIYFGDTMYAVLDFSREDGTKWCQEEINTALLISSIISNAIERRHIEKQLVYAKESAERSNRYKTDFLAKMSHEIRTPMNAIIGMTELALREEKHDVRTEHIFTIKQAGENLLAIINDILDFSKIEAGKVEIVPKDYSVASLLNDVVSIIRMRVVDSQICFAVKADSNIPHTLYGDEMRIRQAVLNILSNAVKYTESGFVSFGVYGERIDDGMVNLIFEVTDSGIGIKTEDMEKLFTDFTQFDIERNRGIEGVGLGLAITRSIVKMMGGDITVQSEYGKGSTFTVTLPQKVHSRRRTLAKVEHRKEKSVLIYERREIYADSIKYTVDNLGVDYTLVSNGTELYENMESRVYDFLFISFSLYKKNEDTILKFGENTKTIILTEFGEAVPDKYLNVISMPIYCTSLADLLNGIYADLSYNAADTSIIKFSAPNARVLIVDDINTNLKVAQGLLTPYNMQVDSANNGAAAIEAVKSERYDLVFMDHKMPDMDGVEATKQIRAMGGDDSYYKEIPIIALTANAVSGIMDMFIENGFNDFLSKPIDTVKLNAILEKWIPVEKRESKSGYLPEVSGFSIERPHLTIGELDVGKGLANMGGRIELYIETLSVFYTDVTEKLGKITVALESDDLSLYSIYTHALKSAASIIGASMLAESAEALEMAGKRRDKAYIAANNDAFISRLNSVLKNVEDALDTIKKDSRKGLSNDTKTIKADLIALKDALDAMNARKINRLVEKLRKSMQGTTVGTEFNKISDSILIGDFDDAAALITILIKENKI